MSQFSFFRVVERGNYKSQLFRRTVVSQIVGVFGRDWIFVTKCDFGKRRGKLYVSANARVDFVAKKANQRLDNKVGTSAAREQQATRPKESDEKAFGIANFK